MFNAHRGEIVAALDGQTYRLCLTLGALAELESAFGHEDMIALANRFSTGRIAARDAARIIGAGLRGAGHDITDAAVLKMRTDGGVTGYVDIVARLLAATFGADAGGHPKRDQERADRGAGADIHQQSATSRAADTSYAISSLDHTPTPPMGRAEFDEAQNTLSPSFTGRGQGEAPPNVLASSSVPTIHPSTPAPNAHLRTLARQPDPFHGPR